MQLFVVIALVINLVNAQDWWKSLHGTLVETTEEFKEQINRNNDSHLVLNFFMEHCPYCRMLQPDWNKLHDEVMANKTEKVVFLVINGPKTRKVTHKYQITGFPTLLYAKPGTKGLEVNELGDDRDYESLKKWLSKNIQRSNQEIQSAKIESENIKKALEEEVAEPGDSTTIEGQLQNLVNSVYNIKGKLEKGTQAHKEISEKEVQKLERLSKKFKSYNELAKQKLRASEAGWIVSFAYVLGGFVSGLILVFMIVIFSSKEQSQVPTQSDNLELQTKNHHDEELDTTGGSFSVDHMAEPQNVNFRKNTRSKTLAKKQ